jgi:predicted RNA binding protein YcfA (HicA-like mRNA interferase family)
MKKIPRNLSGQALVKRLKKLGYITTRQSGSHLRVTTEENGTHHLTIPNHTPLKVGMLSNILKDVADHFKMTKEELLDKLF